MTTTEAFSIRLDPESRLDWDWIKLLSMKLNKTAPTLTEITRAALTHYRNHIDTMLVNNPEDVSYEFREIAQLRKPRATTITIKQVEQKVAEGGIKPLSVIRSQLHRQHIDRLLSGDLDKDGQNEF